VLAGAQFVGAEVGQVHWLSPGARPRMRTSYAPPDCGLRTWKLENGASPSMFSSTNAAPCRIGVVARAVVRPHVSRCLARRQAQLALVAGFFLVAGRGFLVQGMSLEIADEMNGWVPGLRSLQASLCAVSVSPGTGPAFHAEALEYVALDCSDDRLTPPRRCCVPIVPTLSRWLSCTCMVRYRHPPVVAFALLVLSRRRYVACFPKNSTMTSQSIDAVSPVQILRLPQVCKITGLCRSMIYQLESECRFPSGCVSGWPDAHTRIVGPPGRRISQGESALLTVQGP
jgi:predicted DNA-binding transcriptional regulator AlpA